MTKRTLADEGGMKNLDTHPDADRSPEQLHLTALAHSSVTVQKLELQHEMDRWVTAFTEQLTAEDATYAQAMGISLG